MRRMQADFCQMVIMLMEEMAVVLPMGLHTGLVRGVILFLAAAAAFSTGTILHLKTGNPLYVVKSL